MVSDPRIGAVRTLSLSLTVRVRTPDLRKHHGVVRDRGGSRVRRAPPRAVGDVEVARKKERERVRGIEPP
jgi:hypothetical protein